MNSDFYFKNLSYSSFRTFISNPGEFQNNKLLGVYDNTTGVSASVGTILHKFVETYLKTGNLETAVLHCYKCIYDGSDGNTYIVDPDGIDLGKATLENIKAHWKTKVVDFKKTGSNEQILKDVKAGIDAFISEEVDYGQLLAVEESLEFEAIDLLNGTVEVKSPIPFTAIPDEVCRTDKERVIIVNGEVQNIPTGSIFIEDTKFKGTHSEMNAEDPSYIFQAFFNYYCVKAKYGESPKFMTFREIKTSKNKDGASQHQTITIPFFGEDFEEYKVYFWRYILETFERMKIIQERDFLFNIFDMFNGAKEWEKQKAYYLGVPVGQLKSKIAMTSKNKVGSNVPVMGDRDPFKNLKTVKAGTQVENLHSIEDKIRIAFMNFGVKVQFEKKIDGYAFDQYLFSTARGTKLDKLPILTLELMQALEVKKGLRIEPLVKGTKFIGVEIPREDRQFAPLPKLKKEKIPMLPIGINISGEIVSIDLSNPDSSHVIVAGQSGSGKSEFLKTAIHAVKPHGKITIIDPKKVGLLKVKKHADMYLTEIEQIALYLRGVCGFMEADYSLLESLELESIYEYKEKNPKGKKLEDHFIFIDELATISSAIQQIETKDKNGNIKVDDYDIGKEIMGYIAKIANLGRAVGYHLIMATQRPSIKVISGDIKANISCRICFALATQIDSKVVLDKEGAEELLGKGDLLFMNRGIERLQGFYI